MLLTISSDKARIIVENHQTGNDIPHIVYNATNAPAAGIGKPVKSEADLIMLNLASLMAPQIRMLEEMIPPTNPSVFSCVS